MIGAGQPRQRSSRSSTSGRRRRGEVVVSVIFTTQGRQRLALMPVQADERRCGEQQRTHGYMVRLMPAAGVTLVWPVRARRVMALSAGSAPFRFTFMPGRAGPADDPQGAQQEFAEVTPADWPTGVGAGLICPPPRISARGNRRRGSTSAPPRARSRRSTGIDAVPRPFRRPPPHRYPCSRIQSRRHRMGGSGRDRQTPPWKPVSA